MNALNLKLFGEYPTGELKTLEEALKFGEEKFRKAYDTVNNQESSKYNKFIKSSTKSLTIYA